MNRYAKAGMAVLGAVLTSASTTAAGATRDQIIGTAITTAVTALAVYRVPNAPRRPTPRRQAPASVTLYPEPDPGRTGDPDAPAMESAEQYWKRVYPPGESGPTFGSMLGRPA